MIVPTTAEVLVVGAGPAGLAAACTLRANGVEVVVVDAAPEPSTSSRAIVIHSRTLEVMEGLGIVEGVLKEGLIIGEGLIRNRQGILGSIGFAALKAKYPMVVSLAQADTERILKQRLEALGGSVHRGAQVVKVSENEDGVLVEINTSDSTSYIQTQYVIAADGRKSCIREQLGIPFEGGGYNHQFILADIRLLRTGPLRPDVFQEFLSPANLLLYIPLPRNIWRVVATVDHATGEEDMSVFQRLTDERAGPGVKIDEMMWSSRFRIQHGLAARYRKGRVFLAGDAAHCHPPVGGQGMNIGIQDGVRLSNILTEALHDGKTTEADLDRYERERRPIAKDVVALAHQGTVINTLESPVLCVLRDWVIWALTKIPPVRYAIAYRLSGLGYA